jgi:ATP synthase protein I
MTTAPLPPGTPARPVRISREVRLAAAATCAIGVPLVALSALVSGLPGAAGAVLGTLLVVLFFGFGALTVDAVATISPAASLLVALLTYTLQVVALGMVFLVLRASGTLDTTIDAGWLGGSVIAATLVWLVAQIVAATRSRQPLYDLPDRPSPGSAHGAEASAP